MRAVRPDGGSARFVAAVIATGALAGAGAALLTLLMHGVQWVLFGAASARTADAAALAGPLPRTLAVVGAGIVAAVGWRLLRASPIPSPAEALAGRRMPMLRTVLNAALQVAAVAAGASAGREGAPRELGALAGDRLAVRLTTRQRAVLIACGAGAGLAAVYDVPVAGVLFALETMLLPTVADAVLPAIGCTAVAVLTARALGATPGPLYAVREAPWGPSLVVLALVLGPLLGLAGAGYAAGTDVLTRSRRRPAAVLVLLPLASLLVAALAAGLPQVLGNGQAVAELAFSAGAPIGLLIALGLAKAIATTATLGAGSAGGRLTPSLAIGAALGAAAGIVWNATWPGAPSSDAAMIGGAVFLATAAAPPLTAIALVVEFTGSAGLGVTPPMLLAVATAVLTTRWLRGRSDERVDRSAED